MSEPDAAKVSAALPDTAPVFPLPDHVFLPASPTPYRIFEPRYRAMIEHLLKAPERDRWLAIPRLKPGWRQEYGGAPPFHEVATVGRLVRCNASPDNTYHIVVDQGRRCRLQEIPSRHPFRLARVTLWPDDPLDLTPGELAGQFDALLQVVAVLARALGPGARGLVALAHCDMSIDDRVFRLGSVLVQNADRRQELLESRRIRERIDSLLEAAAVLLTLASGPCGDKLPPVS